MTSKVPAYFDALIDGFRRGMTNRFVHMGYWEQEPYWPAQERPAAIEFLKAQERLNEVLLDMGDLVDGQDVLDIGCGFGGCLEAIDQTLLLLQQLTPCLENSFDWFVGDALALPFEDDSFDRIFCIEAMFHFNSRKTFFQEAARVLRRGGILVVSDIFLTGPAKSMRISEPDIFNVISDGYGPWPDLWGAEDDHRAIAAAAGLTCSQYRDVTKETAPTHQFTAPRKTDTGNGPVNAMTRAALALQRLHLNGHLTYANMRFDKEQR